MIKNWKIADSATVIKRYLLNKFMSLADGTGVYPASVIEDSALAKILSKADPAVTTSYDNTTDSLEALSDKITVIDDFVDTEVAAIKVVTDALILPVTAAENTVTANWNTATGTSGEAGEDLVSFGADATKRVVGCLKLDVSACLDGSVLTVKLFEKINGTAKKVYSQGFVVNTDPDGLRIITAQIVITDVMRCEVYSNTSESVAIAYEVA